MTRDVRIQESGVAQDFSDVKTVTTPVVGGGNATWMPEDETAVGEITITGNGEFVPSEHDLYGFYKVNVMVPGGGQGEYVSPGGIGVNIDGTIPMTQPNGTVSNVHVGTGVYTPPPAGIGGTVSGVSVSGGTIAGIDPDTGDYVQYTVVDSDGVPTLSKTTPQSEPRPTSIKIINPPSQTTYAPGALIKFSGLTVGVYDQNGNPFTAPAFTVDGHTYGPYDGTIPFYELSFPVKYTSESSGQEPGFEVYTDNNGVNAVLCYFSVYTYEQGSATHYFAVTTQPIGTYVISGITRKAYFGDYTVERESNIYSESVQSLEGKKVFITQYDGHLYVALEFGSHGGCALIIYNEEKQRYYGPGTSSESILNTFKRSPFKYDSLDVPESTENPNGVSASSMIKKGKFVPVEWKSPYDGITYGDHFEIKIYDGSDDGYSGSGGGSF